MIFPFDPEVLHHRADIFLRFLHLKSPDCIGAERPDLRVRSRNRERLDQALGSNHAVERIPVRPRQGTRPQRVIKRNCQLSKTILRNSFLPLDEDVPTTRQFADSVFDRQLPGTRSAHPHVIMRISQQSPEPTTELLGLAPCPEESACVQQQIHSRPSQAAKSASSSARKRDCLLPALSVRRECDADASAVPVCRVRRPG